MNCPQCQTPNQQDSAFCANCGAQLAPAAATAAQPSYFPPPGQSAPAGYGAPGGSDAPGYGPPSGYGQSGAPGGQYPPPGQPPAGFPPAGQYQPAPARTPAAPIQFDLKRLTRDDKIVGVASLVTMISIFLPWYSISSEFGSSSASGTTGHGWLWLVFVLDLLILAYLAMCAGWDEPPVKLPGSHAMLLIAATGLQLLLVLLAFAIIPYANLGVGWDFGAFVGLIAALAAAAPFIVPAVRSYLQSRR
jgi:hypothetical protein